MQVPTIASGKLRFALPARGFANSPFRLPAFDDQGAALPHLSSPVTIKQEVLDEDFSMDVEAEDVPPVRACTVETEIEDGGMTDSDDDPRGETPTPQSRVKPTARMRPTTGRALLQIRGAGSRGALHLGVGALVRSFSDLLLPSPQKASSSKPKAPEPRGRTPRRSSVRPFRSPSAESDGSISTSDYVHHLSTMLKDTLLPTAHAVLDAACPQALYGWDWMTPAQAVSIARERSVDAAQLLDGRFEHGGLKAWDCWVWGRNPTNKSGKEPKLAGKGDDTKYFLRGCWDEDSVKGKLGMLVVVQPEWFVRCRLLSHCC